MNRNGNTLRSIFVPQTVLIIVFSMLLSVSGVLLNLRAENARRDQNLRNTAEAVAQSGLVDMEALDTLISTLDSIDVLSVIGGDGVRAYHSNHALIGTVYDGTLPVFEGALAYTSDDNGPSGAQRRAYAPVYRADGSQNGFVLAVMLNTNIRAETHRLLAVYSLITLCVVAVELIVSKRISGVIRKRLDGYEPEAFYHMYNIRENILESLEEGIVSVDAKGNIQYTNAAARELAADDCGLRRTLESGEKEFGAVKRGSNGAELVIDRIPVLKNGRINGAVGILHDRTEYTRMAEDLAGTRFLIDSMRANNHDFTNKLHVILGLLEMDMRDEAKKYISNIVFVQRELISSVMRAIDEPAVAALIIGKIARASELNIRFELQEGCCLRKSDINIPQETLVTVMGNLMENALEAMNGMSGAVLSIGVYSKPGTLVINVTDTGNGIPPELVSEVFEKGVTTKGEGHGTGLTQVKMLVTALGGEVSFVTGETGTSFTVKFQ